MVDAGAPGGNGGGRVGVCVSREPAGVTARVVLVGGRDDRARAIRFTEWHRVVGVEWSEVSVRRSCPPERRPRAAQIGIGESLDAPFRRKVRAYVSLVINP